MLKTLSRTSVKAWQRCKTAIKKKRGNSELLTVPKKRDTKVILINILGGFSHNNRVFKVMCDMRLQLKTWGNVS